MIFWIVNNFFQKIKNIWKIRKKIMLYLKKINGEKMSYPNDLKYTEDHEWIKVEGNFATIGITHHAQSELGDIAYIDIDEELKEVKAGECFGTIEAVKAVADLNSPVTGNVAEINISLNDDPAVVNTDPYEKGWMIKIELSNPTEADSLMTAAAYMDFIK